MLRKLLAMFVTQYSDTIPKLKHLIAEGQYQDAFRLVHTLKAVAGNLEAAELAEIADVIEQTLRENNLSNIDALINQLDTILTAALHSADPIRQTK